MRPTRPHRNGPVLLVLCVVVVLVAAGFARGWWLANLHNGLLAFSLTFVGVGVLLRRPGHREGLLLLVAGVLEAVLFMGRQFGHDPMSEADRWWGWLGVWPLALTIAAVTWCVLCFPGGSFLSTGWRRVGIAVAAVAALGSLASSLSPVEYDAAGVVARPPFAGIGVLGEVWGHLNHPVYLVFQVLWVVAIAARWRSSNGLVRRQLAIMLGAVATSVVALVAGLGTTGSPRAGVLAAMLVPLAAGWALERLSLGEVIALKAESGRLTGLTPRENDVLDLMAQGLSNAAIASRLHLSVKTVEPVVTSIFGKLEVPVGSENNRRVLAVVEYLRR